MASISVDDRGEVNLYPANGQTKITVRTEVIAVLKHYGIV